MPMVSKRVSASASGSASTTLAGRTKLWVTRPRRHRGRPKSAPWICRCAWTTLARRPQLHRANNSGRWFESDQEKERPSPYERTPAVLGLGSTAPFSPCHSVLHNNLYNYTTWNLWFHLYQCTIQNGCWHHRDSHVQSLNRKPQNNNYQNFDFHACATCGNS